MSDINTDLINIWRESCPVRFGDVDRSDRMTLVSVFNFFQNAAISHAESLGVGREAMARNRQGWILSRMSVRIHERPRYMDTVAVRTWPRGSEKLFAVRHFDIQNSQNIPIIQAKSWWLVIDIDKRRPLRPQSAMDKLPLNDGVDAIPAADSGAEAGSLTERPNLQKTSEHKTAYSDLDYMGHVNNVSYIRWIQDSLDPIPLENADQMRLDINYLHEVLPGEIVEIWTAPIPGENAYAIEGRKAGSPSHQAGNIAFRAELRCGTTLRNDAGSPA
ncbi:MAG: thioesterase [Treponema sp.]|nr:thioesterase [Treponema sp.]